MTAEMPEYGVTYLTVGQSHLVRLAVSLYTLRRHYSGPITIINGGGDGGVVPRIAEGSEASVLNVTAADDSKNGVYAFKGSLGSRFPYALNLWLDADTTVHGPVGGLFDAGDAYGLAVTQFSDWRTTGRVVSKRINRWRKVCSPVLDVVGVVDLITRVSQPAVNTGVFVVRREHPFLSDWADLCGRLKTFIADEIACQLLLTKHRHVMLSDRWNWSPLYGIAKNPVIRHYHGGKHMRRVECRAHWEPNYHAARLANYCAIKSWSGILP